MSKIFRFYTEYNLPLLLGLKAKNINELTSYLKTVPSSSIYYHTHRFLQVHHYLIPEPPNDFSYWIRNILNLRELGEMVASINIASLKNIDEVRTNIINRIENYNNKELFSISCLPGDEFQFMSCKTFCIPLRQYASNLNEFADIMEKITVNTLYYHIFETQLRLGQNKNDFADWIDGLGYSELAEKISRLDPYTTTLEGLREDIIKLIRGHDTVR